MISLLKIGIPCLENVKLVNYLYLINHKRNNKYLITMSCVIVMKTILDDWEVRTCQKPKK